MIIQKWDKIELGTYLTYTDAVVPTMEPKIPSSSMPIPYILKGQDDFLLFWILRGVNIYETQSK